ncbi:MAG: PP2C family serine/threonine-protein phosphatase [Myxococcota bacterium]
MYLKRRVEVRLRLVQDRLSRAQGYTDPGPHETNSDAFQCGAQACAIADGGGVHAGAQIASHLAVTALIESTKRSRTLQSAATRLRRGFKAAQAAVVRESKGVYADMGTSLSAVIVSSDRVVVGSVGNSPVFRLREGRLDRLTVDHAWSALPMHASSNASKENASPNVAATHSASSKELGSHKDAELARSVGSRGTGEPDIDVLDRRPGDRYVLCTDGVSVLTNEALLKSAARNEAAKEIVLEALRWGAEDHVTAIVIEV